MGVPTEKVSLTLDADALRQARARAGRRGLSAYVDEALKMKLQHERIRRLLDELESEYGPIPDDVRKEVDREWREAGRPARRSRRAD